MEKHGAFRSSQPPTEKKTSKKTTPTMRTNSERWPNSSDEIFVLETNLPKLICVWPYLCSAPLSSFSAVAYLSLLNSSNLQVLALLFLEPALLSYSHSPLFQSCAFPEISTPVFEKAAAGDDVKPYWMNTLCTIRFVGI